MAINEFFLDICGEELRIRSDESEEYIKKLAHYIELKANEPLKSHDPLTGGLSLQTRLIYAAVNITDEMFKVKKELDQLKEDLANMRRNEKGNYRVNEKGK